jgi:hypothetical protein
MPDDAWRADARPPHAVVTPEPWPPNAAARKEWVAAIVRDIDERSPTRRYGLVLDLLRAAWPSWSAQDQ